MKVIAPVLFIAGLFAAVLPTKAQIRHVQAQQINQYSESLVLGLTAYSSGTFYQNVCNWTSPSAPATLSTGGTMSGGVYDGYTFAGGSPYLYSSGNNMSNAAARAVIRGKNNNGGVASILSTWFLSTNAVTVVIWGPTLNSFGVTGATNFTWTATAGTLGNPWSKSGSGEDSFVVPQWAMAGGLSISFTPSNDNELGSVMANVYN